MNNKRQRPVDADDVTNVEKRPRLTSTETTGIDSEGHLSSGPIAGITSEEQTEATSIAETVSAVCRSLLDRVCEVDTSENEETQIANSSMTVMDKAEDETAEDSDYFDTSILRSYEYYFGEE